MALLSALVFLLVWFSVRFWMSKSRQWAALVWILPLNIICALVVWFLYLSLLESGSGASVNHMDFVRSITTCLGIAIFFTPIWMHIELRKKSKQTSQKQFDRYLKP